MESVEKDHVRDGVHETPTVCGTPGTPHDMDVDQGDEVAMPSSLHNRAPSTQRVRNEIKTMDGGRHESYLLTLTKMFSFA